MNLSFSTIALITFVAYTVAVFVLAWFSRKMLAKRSFLGEYFLGSRGLGVIAFTLTFGATSASAGSFAGFPALIYTHGWVLALWIAGYMVVPLCAMGLLGKRLNQVGRRAGCITLPDVLRERFSSPALALTASLLMVLMLSFYLIPQFKLAAVILQQLLADTPLLAEAAKAIGRLSADVPVLGSVDVEYLICLLIFAVLVVVYTTYGGFRAVVWTDVLQGCVMLVGVVALLCLALARVGSLESATQQMSKMTPPRLGTIVFQRSSPSHRDVRVPTDTWLLIEDGDERRLLRTNETAIISHGRRKSNVVKVVEITTPSEIRSILAKWPNGPPPIPDELTVHIETMHDYAYGAGQPGVYVSAPGPVPPNPNSSSNDAAPQSLGFLPVGMAVSFFLFWTLSGTGQPGSLVRLMAFDSSTTLCRSIVALTLYFGLIYLPLVVIFCCARVFLPGLDQTPDRIMPAVAMELSTWAAMPWLAGLLLAVPFAAAMSTVDSFMLMISSSVVRDVYQKQLNPAVSERGIARLSYLCMLIVGAVVTLGAIDPPRFMQYLIVFASGGLSVTFLIPVAMALYWPRASTAGMLAGMLGGLAMYLSLYLIGFLVHGRATAYLLLQLDPTIWGFFASALVGIVVSLSTSAPDRELVRRFFES